MNLTRRNALKGSAAVAAAAISAGGVPAVVNAKTSSLLPAAANEPLIGLVDEMSRLREAWNTADVNPDQSWLDVPEEEREPRQQECERCRGLYWDLQWEICTTPANSIEGLLAKVRSFYSKEEEARVLAGEDVWDGLPVEYATSVYGDLLRLAGEAPA